jgi:glutathionyl-hydroquinone reductase
VTGRGCCIVSLACPWACRALTALYLKGLEGAIGVSVVHPTWQRTRPDDPEDSHCGESSAIARKAP